MKNHARQKQSCRACLYSRPLTMWRKECALTGGRMHRQALSAGGIPPSRDVHSLTDVCARDKAARYEAALIRGFQAGWTS